jgi:zinc transporter ZupT
LASSVTLSYLIPAFFFAFSQFVGALVETAMSAGILAPFLASGLFAVSGLMLFVACRVIKSKLFGLEPSGLLTSAFSASARVGIIKEKLAHVFDSKPEEATW